MLPLRSLADDFNQIPLLTYEQGRKPRAGTGTAVRHPARTTAATAHRSAPIRETVLNLRRHLRPRILSQSAARRGIAWAAKWRIERSATSTGMVEGAMWSEAHSKPPTSAA